MEQTIQIKRGNNTYLYEVAGTLVFNDDLYLVLADEKGELDFWFVMSNALRVVKPEMKNALAELFNLQIADSEEARRDEAYKNTVHIVFDHYIYHGVSLDGGNSNGDNDG